jgi:hypothetical protein
MNEVDEWLAELSREWGVNFDRLHEIQAKAHLIESKLKTLYNEKFPKKCNSCGAVFETRESYLEATKPLSDRNVRFDKFVDKVQEYRNCTCGSTLMIMMPDRRDMTEFGIERRAIFDQLVALIVEMKKMDQEDAKKIVRKIFKTLANKG